MSGQLGMRATGVLPEPHLPPRKRTVRTGAAWLSERADSNGLCKPRSCTGDVMRRSLLSFSPAARCANAIGTPAGRREKASANMTQTAPWHAAGLCSVSRGRWKWARARATYPKARAPDRFLTSAQETFCCAFTALFVQGEYGTRGSGHGHGQPACRLPWEDQRTFARVHLSAKVEFT